MNDAHGFEQAVLGTIRSHAAIVAGDRVLVAVSGGADSSALLAVLDALRRRGALPVELAVAHLDHRLRGAASARDADFVRERARRLGLPCFVGEAPALAAVRANHEAAARAARHAFLAETAADWGATRVALAHTRDDQAETVVLRLARGAGPASLGAMRVVRDDGLVRPLLEQPRAACVAYLEERGLAWVEDESNRDPRFFRNRVRRRLLPLLDQELGVDVRARLARLARQLHEESALAEQRIASLLQDCAPGGDLPLARVHEAGSGGPRLLHAWLARAGIRASERQVATLEHIVRADDPSATVVLAGGRRVTRCYEVLRLLPPAAAAERAATCDPAALAIPGVVAIAGWRLSAEPAVAGATSSDEEGRASLVDGDLLAAPLWVRAPVPGDRVRLVYGRRKLADILIDAKIPRHERAGLAVVGSGRDVLWVPGVVRSVVAGASATTRHCVVLRAERRAAIE